MLYVIDSPIDLKSYRVIPLIIIPLPVLRSTLAAAAIEYGGILLFTAGASYSLLSNTVNYPSKAFVSRSFSKNQTDPYIR